MYLFNPGKSSNRMLPSGGVGDKDQGSSSEEDLRRGPPEDKCCLMDDNNRCQRSAGVTPFSKRLQKAVKQFHLKIHVDPQVETSLYICDYHLHVIQLAHKEWERENELPPAVNFCQLRGATLNRYQQHFNLPTEPGLSKEQLADVLLNHFKTIPVNEKETLTEFFNRIQSKRYKGNDQKNVNVNKTKD